MNYKKASPFRLGVLTLACVSVLAACQTTPPVNADLENARSTIAQARANPYAARAAAVELDRAQQALARAEKAWADDRDREETQHLAYLAGRRGDIAMALAAQAQSEEKLQQAGAERERVRLEARTREAEQSAQTARSAMATAQSAQGQAAQSRRDADSARADASSARAEVDAARMQTAQEGERAAALQRDLESLQGRSTQRGMVVTLGDVLFSTGRAELQPGALRSVQQLAQVMQQYPERRVLIEGFTDSTGSLQLNMDLSQRRAEAFAQAMRNAGVAAERMEVRAQGPAFAVADNGNAAGRQQNRRVEVLFSNAEGRFAAR